MKQNFKEKILYVNSSFNSDSGCSLMALNTYKLFKDKGHPTDIFSIKGFTDIYSDYEKYFPSLCKSKIEYIKNIPNYYYNRITANNFEKVLEEYKPRIVHFHSVWTNALTTSIINCCAKKKIPMVMTLHDVYLLCPAMTLIDGKDRNCSDIKCKDYNKFHCFTNKCVNNKMELSLRVALMAFINKMSFFENKINKYILPSNTLKEIMIKNHKLLNDKNTTTVYNFIADSEVAEFPNYNNKGYFLYIGRLSKEKGVQYLLEAFKYLPHDIGLHIVGKGLEEDNLRRYAEENGLYNVQFMGFKSREEIAEEYRNCISTVLPCNWFEIFGMTNVESFMNGKPVIASNIGAIPEVIENNSNGLLFEPANIEQLKNCILKYWNDPDLVVEHGRNAYKQFVAKYTQDIYYEKLHQIYSEIIENA